MTETNMSRLTAFVLGGTGEIGRELLNALALHESFVKVVLIGRRQLELNGEKYNKVEQNVIDFDKMEESASVFEGFDVGYCCLGTTKAKSGAEGFFKVDHDYVVGAAKLAKQGGCKQFHLVSSAGANKNSWFLYPRTKGLVETELAQFGFNRLCVYRPAVLLCDRQVSKVLFKICYLVNCLIFFCFEQENRPLEKIRVSIRLLKSIGDLSSSSRSLSWSCV